MYLLNKLIRMLLPRLSNAGERGAFVFSREAEHQQVAEIAKAEQAGDIPALAMLLFAGGGAVNVAARNAIHRIVGQCPPLVLAYLDQRIREVGDWRVPRVAPSEVSRLAGGLSGAMGVFSFHANGYVREEAVRLLSEVRDGNELPFLLIRLNDWVHQVQERAAIAIRDRISSEYANHFVRCLPLVERLKVQGRGDHVPLAEEMTELLCAEPCRPVLREGITSADRHVRRIAFRLMTLADDQTEWLEDSIQARDTIIRLRAVQELRQRLKGDSLYGMLQRLMKDRSMLVRREALCGLAEKFPERSEMTLKEALLDAHAWVRETGRFYLRKAGVSDFAAIYRRRLGQVDDLGLEGAISGLGETGTREDASALRRYLKHHAARVRRASVQAMGRLDPEGCRDETLKMLGDPVSRVAKAARDILRDNLLLVSAGELWAIFHRSKESHERRMVLALVAGLSWWDSAPLLVMASGADDGGIKADAIKYLWNWERKADRLSSHPTVEQARMLDDAIALHGAQLESGLREDITSLLSYAKREYLGIDGR